MTRATGCTSARLVEPRLQTDTLAEVLYARALPGRDPLKPPRGIRQPETAWSATTTAYHSSIAATDTGEPVASALRQGDGESNQYPTAASLFSMVGVASAATTAEASQSANLAWKATRKTVVPPRRQARAVLRAVKDASRRDDAVTSPLARPSLTAPPRVARSHGRSAPGNGPDSPTRKCPPETPLLRRTKRERAAT